MSSHDLIDGGKLGRNDEVQQKNRKASFPSTRFLLHKIIVNPGPRVKTNSLRPWEMLANRSWPAISQPLRLLC